MYTCKIRVWLTMSTVIMSELSYQEVQFFEGFSDTRNPVLLFIQCVVCCYGPFCYKYTERLEDQFSFSRLRMVFFAMSTVFQAFFTSYLFERISKLLKNYHILAWLMDIMMLPQLLWQAYPTRNTRDFLTRGVATAMIWWNAWNGMGITLNCILESFSQYLASENLIRRSSKYSWFQAFVGFWILYMFFWVFPRRQFEVCRRFGTLCRFHLQRLDVDYGA